MNILKTPHQMLQEEIGMTPVQNGYLKTPSQLLFEEAGVLPRYEEGGEVAQPSPAAMRAEMMATQNPQPQEAETPEEEMAPEEESDAEEEAAASQLNNQAIFDELKAIINNPGEIPKSSADPKLANVLLQIFGPNIFSPEQESQ